MKYPKTKPSIRQPKKFDMNVGITWENFEIAADYLFPKESSNAQ